METTEQIIESMLKENTGTHFLDSGGLVGRAWQHNQTRDFKTEPACSIEVWEDEVIVTYNVFHFLNNFLVYNEQCKEWEKRFFDFAETQEYKDKPWKCVMEGFVEESEDIEEAFPVENTYGGECLVGQVIQYAMFYCDETYIILQIHNGADVRGGYTSPRIFHLGDSDYWHMAMQDLSAFCSGCKAQWHSDDAGYHWQNDNRNKTEWKFNKDKVNCECGGELEFDVMGGEIECSSN